MGYVLVWNLIVFAAYGIDKKRAINDEWRIPEKTLLLASICFGGIGAFLGMYTFHHKTKHKSFQIIVPIAAIITAIAIIKM